MSGVQQVQRYDLECPHCHKGFVAEPIAGGRAARYRGFKCPHCNLFVPFQRATGAALGPEPDRAR